MTDPHGGEQGGAADSCPALRVPSPALSEDTIRAIVHALSDGLIGPEDVELLLGIARAVAEREQHESEP